MANQTFAVAPDGGKRVVFDFAFWTDRDHSIVQTFGAIPVVDPVQIARINKLAARKTNDGTLELIEAVKSAVRRTLDDSDGVPADWFPTAAPEEPVPDEPLALPAEHEWPSASMGELVVPDPEEPEALFIAPDGTFVGYDKLSTYTDLAAGSSLRRWRAYMDDDERDLMVPLDQLLQLWRWLCAQAGKGLTAK